MPREWRVIFPLSDGRTHTLHADTERQFHALFTNNEFSLEKGARAETRVVGEWEPVEPPE